MFLILRAFIQGTVKEKKNTVIIAKETKQIAFVSAAFSYGLDHQQLLRIRQLSYEQINRNGDPLGANRRSCFS